LPRPPNGFEGRNKSRRRTISFGLREQVNRRVIWQSLHEQGTILTHFATNRVCVTNVFWHLTENGWNSLSSRDANVQSIAAKVQ
jgi:hypothetical protein